MDAFEEQRFMKKVKKTDSCWLWIASKCNGYGHFGINGKVYRSHRLSYEHYKGKIPDGLVVRHKCDNPACVNPEHLEVGTQKDNVQDCITRGRKSEMPTIIAKGVRCKKSNLTEDDVREIRILREFDFTLKELRNKYNISEGSIWKIINRIAWKHVY